MKSYLDYGAFTPVQVAAAAALNGPEDCIAEMRDDLYASRRDAHGRQLRPGRLGCPGADGVDVRLGADPGAVPARWARVEFSKLLVEKADVAVAPGIGFGEHGDGYVRIALVENEQRIRQAARNIRRFLETGAGAIAQRRPARRRGANTALALDHRLYPVKVGVAGLGTGRRRAGRAWSHGSSAQLTARCGRPIDIVAVSRPLQG